MGWKITCLMVRGGVLSYQLSEGLFRLACQMRDEGVRKLSAKSPIGEIDIRTAFDYSSIGGISGMRFHASIGLDDTNHDIKTDFIVSDHRSADMIDTEYFWGTAPTDEKSHMN